MPFFSVGVVTYNRRQILKDTLTVLLRQTFQDFEVLVGNDYPAEILDATSMGIDDPRVQFVNHPKNLGEGRNMNTLLEMSRGKYFIWQFDDDLVDPSLLEKARKVIESQRGPDCVYTSFDLLHGNATLPAKEPPPLKDNEVRLFTGAEFLRNYCAGNLKALGSAGIFETEYLRKMKGFDTMCKGPLSIHGEFMLLVKSGLLPRVAYISQPLVYFRVHEERWLCTMTDCAIYEEAGENFLEKSVAILSTPGLRADFAANFSEVFRLICATVVGRAHPETGRLPLLRMWGYLGRLHRRLKPLGWSRCYWIAVNCLLREAAEYLRIALCETVKSLLPVRLYVVLKTSLGR